MRIFLAAAAAIFLAGCFLAGCSEDPAPAKKAAEPPPARISGRQAFQYVYGSSRIWASDSMPLTVRSVHVAGIMPEPGKAAAWEVIFVSATQGRARTYTWSAVEAEGLHKGVFPGQQESWRPGGANQAFDPSLLKVDTTDALVAAINAAGAYINKPGERPPVNYVLDYAAGTRYPNPVWRVLWGGSASSAEYSVSVDAFTGKVVARD